MTLSPGPALRAPPADTALVGALAPVPCTLHA